MTSVDIARRGLEPLERPINIIAQVVATHDAPDALASEAGSEHPSVGALANSWFKATGSEFIVQGDRQKQG